MWALAVAFALALGGCGKASTRTSSLPQRSTTTNVAVEAGGPVQIEQEPPQALKNAGGSRLGEFNLGRSVMAQSGCLACHKIGVNGNAGPGQDLTRVGARLSAARIERAILDPTEPMPSFRHLPRAKLHALVVFLSVLGS
jgi:ubiquinol-cytochrome c reductase cytochrome b subunit/menaquinol-cytochrome c reductase cytochrome b/c subunit